MNLFGDSATLERSPSIRREWIEIITDEMYSLVDGQSPSIRREWIEMEKCIFCIQENTSLPPYGGSGLKYVKQ